MTQDEAKCHWAVFITVVASQIALEGCNTLIASYLLETQQALLHYFPCEGEFDVSYP